MSNLNENALFCDTDTGANEAHQQAAWEFYM